MKVNDMNSIRYTNHFVCFLDILGFKNSVLNSISEKKEFERIFSVLKKFEEIKSNFKEQSQREVGILSEGSKEILGYQVIESDSKMCFFSDSIILSYEHEHPRADMVDLLTILFDVSLLTYQFLLEGIFLRGGLSYGKLYHKDDVCFGTALIEAVELEGKAKYPCISIASYIFEQTSSEFPYKNVDINQNNYRYINDIYHAKDVGLDGEGGSKIDFLDYLYAIMQNDKDAERVRQMIIRELDKTYESHVKEKYEWFANYYNASLDSMPYIKAQYIKTE